MPSLEDALIMRGALLAADLQAAAARIEGLSNATYEKVVARSLHEFAAAEGQPEPMQAYPLHLRTRAAPARAASSGDRLGVLAAFHAGHR